MVVKIHVLDGRGSKHRLGITKRGELITGAISYNDTFFQQMTVADQGYNLVTPKAGKQFILMGVSYSGNKDINATTGAEVILYEADAVDAATVERELFRFNVGKIDRGSISGLNVATNPGVWLNAKTDSTDVSITIYGYYVHYDSGELADI